MSWDLILMRSPNTAFSLEDLPTGYYPPALGTREEVLTQMRKVLPSLEDAGYSVLLREENSTLTIDLVSPKDSSSIHMLGVHVRGSESAVALARLIWETFACSAFDSGTGRRVDTSLTPENHMRSWAKYRDQIVNGDTDSTQVSD